MDPGIVYTVKHSDIQKEIEQARIARNKINQEEAKKRVLKRELEKEMQIWRKKRKASRGLIRIDEALDHVPDAFKMKLNVQKRYL